MGFNGRAVATGIMPENLSSFSGESMVEGEKRRAPSAYPLTSTFTVVCRHQHTYTQINKYNNQNGKRIVTTKF